MSLYRLVYYGAFLAGWAALVGWFVAEKAFADKSGMVPLMTTAGLIGALIGAGLNVTGGMANAQWKQLLRRVPIGLVAGALGGIVGSLVGETLHSMGLPRLVGWILMGIGIGAAEGLYERSPSKIRNGLLGGALGGLLGGILFEPILALVATDSGTSSRATAFVILGIAIGALVGLTQVVLKQAWLTVVEGYRAGRQLILTQPVTILGRADHLPMPFLGAANRDLQSEHVKITRSANGSYQVEDNSTRLGTKLNNCPIKGAVPLKDGDAIQLGSNVVRFNQRHRGAAETGSVVQPAVAHAPVVSKPPPPPVSQPPVPAPSANAASPAKPVVKPPQPAAKPSQPAAKPSQPATKPSQPAAPPREVPLPPWLKTSATPQSPPNIKPPPPPRPKTSDRPKPD
jgi:hypothetical protein